MGVLGRGSIGGARGGGRGKGGYRSKGGCRSWDMDLGSGLSTLKIEIGILKVSRCGLSRLGWGSPWVWSLWRCGLICWDWLGS